MLGVLGMQSRVQITSIGGHRTLPDSTMEIHVAQHREANNGPGPGPGPGDVAGHADPISRWKKNLLTAIILLGLMFSCVDTSIVSTALVQISHDLNSDKNINWTVLAYLLTYMSFSVGFSKLSDIFGRKTRSITTLIVGRAFQGIGGAGLYALSQVSLVELGPVGPDSIGALIGITLSVSYILGPILGGVIASHWMWQGIFWINVPAGALAIIGITLLWPQERRGGLKAATAICRIDFIGNILLVLASILLVFGIQEAGSRTWEWRSPVIIATLTSSAVCWVLLTLWEVFLNGRANRNIEPVFPARLFQSRVYVANVILTLLVGFSFVALIIEIPEKLEMVEGDQAMQAGLKLLPLLAACAFGSVVAGMASKSKNLSSQTMMAGSLLQIVGLAVLYKLGTDTNLAALYGSTFTYGLGVGLCFAAGTIIAAVEARNADLAAAHGCISQARVLGGAIGIATCTIILPRAPSAALAPPPQQQQQQQAAWGPFRHDYTAGFARAVFVMVLVAVAAAAASVGTYRRNPASVALSLSQHKDRPARASDTELEDLGSVRSARRNVV
ncbi:hypothetical protein P8C59_009520 [Phyllachora maydis]|uniref:Uncharacterized protein n=1 Tax=Phyllachora maydis TaxID=1825666 RepID=A0AAD9MLD5_9PEZI|nr:hypothetical protein P8C59_009520 [Phyllachora maydis]